MPMASASAPDNSFTIASPHLPRTRRDGSNFVDEVAFRETLVLLRVAGKATLRLNETFCHLVSTIHVRHEMEQRGVSPILIEENDVVPRRERIFVAYTHNDI